VAVVGVVGIGDQPQVPNHPPQPGWVQAAGHRHQHRFGRGDGGVGELLGAGGQHLGMRG